MNNVAVVDTSAGKLFSINREVLRFRVAKFLEASAQRPPAAMLVSSHLLCPLPSFTA
jgi:hypothetical protein